MIICYKPEDRTKNVYQTAILMYNYQIRVKDIRYNATGNMATYGGNEF